MARDVAANLRRESQRIRRLGGGTPVCVFCGESDPRVLQVHHVVGRNHDEIITVIQCKNCHTKVTATQRDLGVDLKEQATFRDRLPQMLLSLAAFHTELAAAEVDWADELQDEPGADE